MAIVRQKAADAERVARRGWFAHPAAGCNNRRGLDSLFPRVRGGAPTPTADAEVAELVDATVSKSVLSCRVPSIPIHAT